MDMLNKLFYILIYEILLCLSFNFIRASIVTINNENELLNSFELANNNKDELIININDVTLELFDNIDIYSSVKKLCIIGTSKENSILKFNDISKGMILTNLNYELNQEIKFVNLTFSGRMEIYSIVNVIFEDVVYNGNLYFDKLNKNILNSKEYNYNREYLNKNLKMNITMSRIIYNALTLTPYRCINLYGNVVINESNFYGHESCVNAIIQYNGDGINNIDISSSYFNGMYKNECIYIYNSVSASIEFSTFENGESYVGGILTYNGSIKINNCTFKNFYTPEYGGVFFIYYPQYFSADKINIYNSTAIHGGSNFFIYSLFNYMVDINLTNINVYGSGNQFIQSGGLIAEVKGKININILNLYGEDLDIGNGYGLFYISDHTSMNIENIELFRVKRPNMGGFLLYSFENTNDSYFHITNGTFVDFYQDLKSPESIAVGSGVILAGEIIDILLK
eukprot:jgi/Orpsp1_1/1179752/evm.model.c7180000070648.1